MFRRYERPLTFGQRLKRFSTRLLAGLIFPVVLLGVLLHVYGLPGMAIDEISYRLEDRGIMLDAERLYLRWNQGLVLEDVSVYTTADRVTPIMTSALARLRPRWGQLLFQREFDGWVILEGGTIQTELGMWADDMRTQKVLRLSRVECSIRVNKDEVELAPLAGSLGNIRVVVTGGLAMVPGPERTENRSRMNHTDVLPSIARRLAEGLGYVEQIKLASESECRIGVSYDPERTSELNVSLDLAFEGDVTYRGVPFDRIAASAKLEHARVHLESCEFVHDNQRLELQGFMDLNAEVAKLSVSNSLPRYYLDYLAPPVVFHLLERQDVRLEGDVDFSLTLGPDSFSEFGRSVEGRFHLVNGYYMDTLFPQLTFDLAYRDRRLDLKGVQGIAGSGREKGPLEAEMMFNGETGAMQIELTGGFNPSVLGRMISGKTEAVVRRFDFPARPPAIQLQVHQESRSVDATVVSELQTGAVIFQGTQLDACSASVRYMDGILSITDLSGRRGSERLTGSLVYDTKQEQLRLDLLSSLHPHALARLAHPLVEQAVNPVQFIGTNRMEIAGVLDLSGEGRNDLRGDFSSGEVTWKGLRLDQLAFSFLHQDHFVQLPDISGVLGDGLLVASLQVTNLKDREAASFATQVRGSQLDLHDLVNMGMDATNNPYAGSLSFAMNLDGLLRDPPHSEIIRESWKGQGHMSIEDGTLFRIPLLFGLSRILSKIVNGFGYASQSDFTADFVVAGGRVHSKNLFLKGNVLSVKGKGYVGLNHRVKMDMQVKLLSDGILSQALQVLTWPISKLIEIQLSGTISEPNWQPKNLPKELFGR